MHAHGLVAGPAGVLEGLGGLAGGCDLGEVAGQLGEVGAGAVLALDCLANAPVETRSSRDRQPLV
jgi:hypothetical protein